MRDAVKVMGEYILELPPEIIVGRDGVTHVRAFGYFKIPGKAAAVRWL